MPIIPTTPTVDGILSDAAVTSSQNAGPVMLDGTNLYMASVDYSDPITGNNNLTSAKIHVFKSSNYGRSWSEKNPKGAPSCFQTTEAVYGSPALCPFLVIDTRVYFPQVPGYTGPQVLPWPMASGSTDSDGNDSGNNTIQINLLEYGYLIQSASLVVNGSFGSAGLPNSIAASLAASLNAQLVSLGISPSLMTFGVGPSALPTPHTGFSENVDDSSIVLLAPGFTGSNWSLSVTGNMIAPYVPAVSGRCVLHSLGSFQPITIFTVVGANANQTPIPLLFNTFAATLENHIIHIAFVGMDSTLTIARFSTTTDTWLSTITGGPTLNMTPYDGGLGANLPCTFVAEIKVRQTLGDIVIAWAVGNSASQATATTYYTHWIVYNASTFTWGTNNTLTTAYVNQPVSSVLDPLMNNVVFFIGGLTYTGGTPNTFLQTFIVLYAGGSSLGPTPVDPGNTAAYITVGLRDAPQIKPAPVQAFYNAATFSLVIAIAYGSSSSNGVYMAEISMLSLISGGAWTIFRTPNYVAGYAQWFGAASVLLWNNKFQVLLASTTGSGSWDGTSGRGIINIGTGNSSGGAIDTSWGSASLLIDLNQLLNAEAAAAGTLAPWTIPYYVSAVLLPSGFIGVLYTLYQFYEPTGAGIAPYYVTRFAVLGQFQVGCATPPSGSVGAPYKHAFSSSGGTLPLVWSIISGSLPPGLVLDPVRGIASGVPTAIGTYNFTLKVTDAMINIVTVACAITITAPFTASCASPPDGLVGNSYSQTFTVTGGTSPYSWALLSGAFPPGVTLNATTGTITGTLTTAGRWYFTLRVTDATGNSAIISCRIQVCPATSPGIF